MELTLLGTGAPEGLPRPGCPCAVCASCTTGDAAGAGDGTSTPTSTGTGTGADTGTGTRATTAATAAEAGEARAATSLLVDGALLLDLTPGPAVAAARAGRSLHGVRQVLLSHPHDGPALEFPSGLPAPVRLPDGQELSLLSGHTVRAVALDSPGTGYQVTAPDGPRLLYLPPGAAPTGSEAPQAPYDIVLLDVLGRPDALAGLREAGAVGSRTAVVAVHIGHDTPQGSELHRRLAAAGARAVPDGASPAAGTGSAEHRHGERPAHSAFQEPPAVPRRTLVLGGARSGKSAEAERRLGAFPGVEYVATGGTRHGDEEWAARVRTHQERRPSSWRTHETRDLVPLLRAEGPPLLIDCLSLWLTGAMDDVGAWDGARWRESGAAELRARVEELTEAVRGTRRVVVGVSNEVGSGVVPETPAGRLFRDELGRLNAAFAAECEHVLLVVAGIATPLRG